MQIGLCSTKARLLTRRFASRSRVAIPRRFNSQDAVKSPANESNTMGRSLESTQVSSQTLPSTPERLRSSMGNLGSPLAAYNRALKNRPYLTQFISSLIVYFLGDLSSQYVQRYVSEPAGSSQESSTTEDAEAGSSKQSTASYDPYRSMRALVIGGTMAIPSYLWFLRLSALWPNLPHLPGVLLKTGLNMVTFGPVINSYFFTIHSLLSGEGGDTLQGKLEAAWTRVKNTVPRTLANGIFFWPAVTAFSLSYVPLRMRSLFMGGAGVCWQTYLGIVNAREARKTKEGMTGNADAEVAVAKV